MIEPCRSVDQPGWLALRSTLWPDCPRGTHLAEMQAMLEDPGRFAQFVCHVDGRPAGLVEASIRSDYVNGTQHSPVAFLEGLFVVPEFRRQGIAGRLVAEVEAWARARGCREIASDALLDNLASHAVHEALGFREAERVVFFAKSLEGPARSPG